MNAPFGIPNTPSNAALASTVNTRIKAEASKVAATASFWRLLGLGLFLALAGIGAGAAFYGYSYAMDTRAAEGRLANTLAAALDHVTLKATLNPDATVRLDSTGAVVKLDGTGVVVPLDARGVALATGTGSVAHPTEQQFAANTRPQSDARVVSNFTVFKSVHFGRGNVVTGWVFNSNEDATPASQGCYYTTGGINGDQNMSMRYDLGKDGTKLPPSPGIPVDFNQAYSNCVWYRS